MFSKTQKLFKSISNKKNLTLAEKHDRYVKEQEKKQYIPLNDIKTLLKYVNDKITNNSEVRKGIIEDGCYAFTIKEIPILKTIDENKLSVPNLYGAFCMYQTNYHNFIEYKNIQNQGLNIILEPQSVTGDSQFIIKIKTEARDQINQCRI